MAEPGEPPGMSGDLVLGKDGVASGGSSRRYRRSCVSGRCGWSQRSGGQHDSSGAAISEVARLLGVGCAETVRKWCARRRSMPAHGPGPTEESAGAEALAAGQRRIAKGEVILKTASASFAAEPTGQHANTRFIADHQGHREGPDGRRWCRVDLGTQLTELGRC